MKQSQDSVDALDAIIHLNGTGIKQNGYARDFD
jgi:hypothetical protein